MSGSYKNNAQETYVYSGGRWLRSGELQFGTYHGRAQPFTEVYTNYAAWRQKNGLPAMSYREWLIQTAKDYYANVNEYQRNPYLKTNLERALAAEGINAQGEKVEPTYLSGSEQFDDLMNKINNGEINVTDEDGLLDTTALREQGDFGNWMADMLENSYKTGVFDKDFIQRNVDGTTSYTPEIQTMLD